MNYSIYKGDDTDAFGNNFLIIELENPSGKKISKAEFKCGTIVKTFINPVFPLPVNLCCDETEKLLYKNCCELVVYDEDGKRRTCECEGDIVVIANGKVL